MYAVGQNEAPRLPARVRVNGAPADAVLWLDATRAARPLPSPASAPTVAEGAAGNLTGAYRWLVAFGSTVMVSYPSPVSDLLTVTGKRVDLSVVPTSTDGRVTKRRIYRTVAGGSVYKLVGEIADNVTADFEDNVADGALTDEYLAVTVFADGNAMDEGADRSRYGNHATQGTAGNRPLFKVGILNGRPVVRADADDELVTPDIGNLDYGTILVVVKLAGPVVPGAWPRLIGYGSGDAFRFYMDSNTDDVGVVVTPTGGAVSAVATTDASTAFIIVGAVYGVDGVLRTFVNGAAGPTNTSSGAITAASGAIYAFSGVWGPGVDLAAALVYNRALPTVERQRTERYFGRKYAIMVS